MIIKDLYQTQIQCLVNNEECYEVDIDSSVNVKVSLIDFNGEPVTNKKFILTVDKGHLTNGKKTIEGETNSNGVYSVAYVPSEFGLATFRVNDKSIKMKVHGRKKVVDNGMFKLFDYGKYVLLEFNGEIICNYSWEVMLSNLIPLKYAPREMVSGAVWNVPRSANGNYPTMEVHNYTKELPLCAIGVRLNETTNEVEILKKLLSNPSDSTGTNITCEGKLSLFWTVEE